MIDVAFDVAGGSVAPGYAPALLAAIVDALPWFAATPQAGVHPLRGSGAAYGELLLARRAKLVLRVPSARATECGALEGRSLDVGERVLQVGRAEARVLRPSATLHAQRVTSATPDGSGFEAEVAAALAAIGVASPFISGRAASGAGGHPHDPRLCAVGARARRRGLVAPAGERHRCRSGAGLGHLRPGQDDHDGGLKRKRKGAAMGYVVEGQELETDAEGYLWKRTCATRLPGDRRGRGHRAHRRALGGHPLPARRVPGRRAYAELPQHAEGHPGENPGIDSKSLYDLFPMGPAKQGAKVAGLPQPYGKGGY